MAKTQLYRLGTVQELSDSSGLLSVWYQTRDLAVKAAELVLRENIHAIQWTERATQPEIRDQLSSVVMVRPMAFPEEKVTLRFLPDQASIQYGERKQKVELVVPVQSRTTWVHETVRTIEQDGHQYSRTERKEVERVPWSDVPWPERFTLTIEPADLWIVETQEELDEKCNVTT